MAQNQKIPVAILGATGMVGQRFVQLIHSHPQFEIAALAASDRSSGKKYRDACQWVLTPDMPECVGDMEVLPIEPNIPGKVAFSALPASTANEVEPAFAKAGYIICSNASSFRQAPDVPLMIPEINAEHIALIDRQRKERGWKGFIVTSPNCTTTGIVMGLKPLDDAFGLKKVLAVSMQAVSGAGYPGIPFLDIEDNVIPYIDGEEEKIEKETRLLLGKIVEGQRVESSAIMSASANRVAVSDGHTICLAMEFNKKPTVEEAIKVLSEFRGSPLAHGLPSSPEFPVQVKLEKNRPQPRRDRDAMGGMVASVGRVRSDVLFDLKMVVVVHNALRGAASGNILNAELLLKQGYIK